MYLVINVLCIFLFPLSFQHFIVVTPQSCQAANKCNHSWVPICGQELKSLSNRLFLDECDMFEYNCDNNKAFVQVQVQFCYKCTQKNSHQIEDRNSTEQTPTSLSISTPAITTVTVTILSRTEESTTISKETTSVQTTTAESVNKTVEEATTTIQLQTVSTSPTVEQRNESVEVTTIEYSTTVKVTDLVALTSSEPQKNVTTANETSEVPVTTVPIPSTNENISTTETNTVIYKNATCYPEDCFVPSTWETTDPTEERSLYQILKQRYGDGMKILRYTAP